MNLEDRTYNRTVWKADVPAEEAAPLAQCPAPYAIVQHTGGRPCATREECSEVVRVIQSGQMSNKWSDIAYNFLVGGDGFVYEGRGWNRTGGHSKKLNRWSIGVAFIGTFTTYLPTKRQLDAFDLLLKGGVLMNQLAPNYTLLLHSQISVNDPILPSNSTLKLIRRKQWDTKYDNIDRLSEVPPPFVVVIHTVTGNCTTVFECSSIVRNLQVGHIGRGYDDIGYNFLVGGDGNVYVGRGWTKRGAHSIPMNGNSIGLAFIGNFNKAPPTRPQLKAAKRFLEEGEAFGKLKRNYTVLLQKNGTERFVTRGEWFALIKTDYYKIPPLTEFPAPFVVIIHTTGSNCFTQQTCSVAVKNIQADHLSRGWGDIGYNFLVGGDGYIYEGLGWNKKGAHTIALNARSIGVAFIGNFMLEPPPKVQTHAAQLLLKIGEENGKLRSNYTLLAHRQVANTLSPGTMLTEEIKKWPHWGVCDGECAQLVDKYGQK
ncbi:hypothetical protein AAG570_011736 [Ranatra chinensis]|uniref:Uncharacterized protein n=1 Tax=Ranatra chinensis TaxID=642074 RepID=A0ABD0YGS5_9HEMI